MALILSCLIPVSTVSAQANTTASELATHIDAVKTLFQELDRAARNCVEGATEDSCHTFASTLDDAFIPAYLSHCKFISEWREQLVAREDSDELDNELNGDLARLLIDAEFTCGEDALAKRTEFTVLAFQTWQEAHADTSLLAPQYDRNTSARSSPVPEALQSQQSRLNQEIDRQWQRVELDNIRQQLRKPVDYGDYNFPN